MRRAALLPLLFALTACSAGGDSGDSGGADSGDSGGSDSGDSGGDSGSDSGDSGSDSGDSGDSGGDSGDSGSSRVCVDATGAQSATIGTVVTVTWTSATPGPSWVEFGPDPTYGYATPGGDDATTDHEVVVVGMPAGRPWHWRAVTEDGDGRCVSEDHEVAATTAPSEVVSLVASGTAAPGWTLLARNVDRPVVLLLNGAGEPCWWVVGEEGRVTTQVRLAHDLQSVLYVLASEEAGGEGQHVVRVALDGAVLADTATPDAHHDFVELLDGRLAYLVPDIRNHDGRVIAGDAIHVTDPDTGATETVWSTWDDVPVVINEEEAYGYYAGIVDWTHANGLIADEANDTWYVSAKNLSQVYKIVGGSLAWTLGDDGDFTLQSGTPFRGQHSPTLVDGGLLIFSNGDKNAEAPDSKVLRYAVDEGARTYRATLEYDFDNEIYAHLLGNAEEVGDGTVAASTGDAGQLRWIDTSGAETGRIAFEGGAIMSYAHPVAAVGGARE